MDIIKVNPNDISYPHANNEMGLRPEPTESDKNWHKVLELKDDIAANGMSDLFSVRTLEPGKYEVINGSRRTKVCQMLCDEGHPDFQEISVQVNNIDEITSLERQVAGNATSEPTNAKQYAAALAKIAVHKNYDVNTLAKAVGRSASFVNNYLGFNRLPSEIKDLVGNGKMLITNAIALTKLPKAIDLSALIEAACTQDTSQFAITIKETLEEYKKERKALKGGSEPKFELTEKKIAPDLMKANLEKAKNIFEDDQSEFNRGYKTAYEEIFQIDEASAKKREMEWEAKQQAKKDAMEARKKEKADQKKAELKKYVKDNNITSLDQLTA